MSIVKSSKLGWFISHELLIKDIYSSVDECKSSYQLKPLLFEINSPYKIAVQGGKRRDKKDNLKNTNFENEVQHVESLYKEFYAGNKDIFKETSEEVINKDAITAADIAYEESGKESVTDLFGANLENAITKKIGNCYYMFPKNCKFYMKDVAEINNYLQREKYDLILLDPPWWNKYIRRKRKHSEQGYDMLYNKDLKNIPIENYLTNDGLVIVWCTNSKQHLTELCNEIFPKWGVKYIGKWYWVKVTKSGIPICPFAEPPRKQPFEQIIIGCQENRKLGDVVCDKLVVSVPSALHSHKPPLICLLESYLPKNPKCLEIFARYLLPDWTSYGKEVLRLQHESLYDKISE